MKTIVTSLLFIFLMVNYFKSQNKPESYILLKSKDTILTKKLNYNWKIKAGFLTYKTPENEIKHIADDLVEYYYLNNIRYTFAINLETKEKFICRELISGKISVFEVINKGLRKEYYIETSSFKAFINNSNFETKLIPILNSCSLFNVTFVNEKTYFLTQHYIRHYNRNCLEN